MTKYRYLFLGLGLLIAYLCIAIPVVPVLLLMHYSSGMTNAVPTWWFLVVFAVVMLIVGVLMSNGVLWLRWPIYAFLSLMMLMMLVTMYFMPVPCGGRSSNMLDSLPRLIAAFIGLVMCPCAIVLLLLASGGIRDARTS